MRPTLHLAILAQALVAGPVLGGELIKPTLDFNDMRVVVTYVSTSELANLQGGTVSGSTGVRFARITVTVSRS